MPATVSPQITRELLRGGRMPRFVKAYADLRGALLAAATACGEHARSGTFPSPEQSY